jgi:hypothetical protein
METENQVLNKYRNKQTGQIKTIWETTTSYENHKPDFYINWEQIQ